ncbi:hypothetical protein FZEAL_5437 [Fusarium zealandicum]|uniref:Zn(2)-C6 fungal-type domain-containing protein n=1 Tax=Fusarium zealandicum TaxID=1053134 RepID=A0A8H4UKM0_9HYPO|nr:hypothetical protein FZEAL_5437 [Fusarium zealandicum]
MVPSPTVAENASDVDIPSCHGCRRRKLKCSREQPSCANCETCVYDAKKNKPGLKAGAVEGLSKRLETLEKAFHDRRVQEDSTSHFDSRSITSNVAQLTGAVTTLASEIQRLASPRCTTQYASPVTGSSDMWELRSPGSSQTDRPHKKRRTEHLREVSPVVENGPSPAKMSQSLPPGLVEEAVHQYFARIFYWIPMIHHPRFRDQVKDESGRVRVGIILDAMIAATLRFIDLSKYNLSPNDGVRIVEEKRNSVILSAMNSLSIESLQALIIVTFMKTGDGDLSKSWSTIASMSKTVEYLSLTTEKDDDRKGRFVAPLCPLSASTDWVQEEERRRVFWNIFNLDRQATLLELCIMIDEVNRRLPAHGTYWYAEMPVVCPYFGNWNRSVTKVSAVDVQNSTILVPSASVTEPGKATPTEDSGTSSMGGFSYAVQATEYLHQIMTCFVYPDISSGDQQEVTAWLTRFKELDLQLVHWKMFLPKKWRDPNRAPNTSTGPHDLDHSMTLAHITHNTSMILLHHRIAYRPAQWRDIVPLPSSCSAETCRLAAAKTSTITETWLRVCPREILVAPQIAFCAYISARVLLVDCRYYEKELIPEFWVLVRNLEQMSGRWAGRMQDGARVCLNLAGKYAIHLRRLQKRWREDSSTAIDLLDYNEDFMSMDDRENHAELDRHETEVHHEAHDSDNQEPSQETMTCAERIPNLPQGHIPLEQTQHQATNANPLVSASNIYQPEKVNNGSFPTMDPEETHQIPEDLLAISQSLMDQRFAEMDRIITLDNSFFDLAGNTSLVPLGEWSSVQMGFADLQNDGNGTTLDGWNR